MSKGSCKREREADQRAGSATAPRALVRTQPNRAQPWARRSAFVIYSPVRWRGGGVKLRLCLGGVMSQTIHALPGLGRSTDFGG
jgi:hypothetical protein